MAARYGELVKQAQHFFRSPRGASSRVVLGSSSKVRRTIMDEVKDEVGFEYQVMTADIDEKAIGDRRKDNPADLVTTLAQAKADAILGRLAKDETDGMLLITCDQVSKAWKSARRPFRSSQPLTGHARWMV